MRYGIFGDVHSNLHALDAVVARLEQLRVDRLLCTGDLVGYGGDPVPCVRKVRALEPLLIAGNHDWAAAGRLSLDFFNPAAAQAIQWTRSMLSREERDWLGSLPLVRTEGEVTLVHSTVHDPEVFDYLQTPYDAYLSFRALTTRTAFVGHSHIAVTFFEGTPILYSVESRIETDGRRCISNVGSVGQPRDEDPRASFGVFDDEAGVIEVHRTEYDVEAAVRSIRHAGLPAVLADRLLVGR